jgi:hypothetical protein
MIEAQSMPEDLPEPRHPSGRELTEIERCLFCIYLVAVEAKRCAEIFLGPEERKHDGPLIFTVVNHAGIIINKFSEAWDDFNGLAKSDERVRKLCAAVKPAIAKIKEWPRLGVYRDQALAHPYRDRQRRVRHPSALLASGAVPLASDEMMYLARTVIIAATAAIVFFESEFLGILPLVEDFGPEPVDWNPMTPHQRDAALRATNDNINAALGDLGIDLKNPLFSKFRLGT